jgi:hypothetical protein
MDIKGDFSGIARKVLKNCHNERQNQYSVQSFRFPVELLTLSEQGGVRLRGQFQNLALFYFQES